MQLKDELGESIRAKMGVKPGHVLSQQSGLSRTDISKIKRRQWESISLDKLLIIGRCIGVKLVYTFEECQPEPLPGKPGKKSGFDVDNMNVEVF